MMFRCFTDLKYLQMCFVVCCLKDLVDGSSVVPIDHYKSLRILCMIQIHIVDIVPLEVYLHYLNMICTSTMK